MIITFALAKRKQNIIEIILVVLFTGIALYAVMLIIGAIEPFRDRRNGASI
jgi:hypothetical protein